jgi:hypothetical protein
MQSTPLPNVLDGTHGNSRHYLDAHPTIAALLQNIETTYAELLSLPALATHGPIVFVGMSHATYLASVQLSTSGQLPPSYMASRGILEASIYGWWVNHRPELKAIWSNRDESAEAKKLVKNSFKMVDIRAALKAAQPAFDHQFGTAYEHTIDMGAHPNAGALWTNMTDPDENGESTYLYINPEEPAQDVAVLTAAFSAVTGMTLFLDAFHEALIPAGFLPHLLELTDRTVALLPHQDLSPTGDLLKSIGRVAE